MIIVHVNNDEIGIYADEIIANKKRIKGYKNGDLVFTTIDSFITIKQEKEGNSEFVHLYIGEKI